MIGNNELQLNEATMIEAVQEYLDKRMTTYAPKVTKIKPVNDSGGYLFDVWVTDRNTQT